MHFLGLLKVRIYIRESGKNGSWKDITPNTMHMHIDAQNSFDFVY